MSDLALVIVIAGGVIAASFLLFMLLIKRDSCPQCPSCDCEHTLYLHENPLYEHWTCAACRVQFVVDKRDLE